MSGEVYIYNGVDEVPWDVTHVRVDPSVTVIPQRAFEDHRKLEVVELPEGLITIGENAFQYCKSLKRINIPSTVIEIGYNAFQGCNKLDGIALPDGLQTMGHYAFANCISLQRINIPPGMKTIGQGAFLSCTGLADVVIPEDLEEIEKDAFSFCSSLVSITLPTSLKSIGMGAFESCYALNEVHMHDSVETIDSKAFKDCSITHFRTPPLTVLDISIFGGNTCLVSLELTDTDDTYRIECSGLIVLDAPTLRSITLPSDCEIDIDLLATFPDLGLAFPDADSEAIIDALRHRYDDLPIHKICYYQSYHDTETTMQNLKREINPWTSNPPGQLNTIGKEQDCLGMTPLHILACSTKPTIEMIRLLIEKYPEALIIKDKWGDIPLLYATIHFLVGEIVDLLMESYKTLHSNYEIGWSGMIQTMAKQRVPLPNIQKLVSTQRRSFPNQSYDMQGLVLELASKSYISAETFAYLLRVSITERLYTLGIEKWRIDLENSINRLFYPSKREEKTRLLLAKLAAYESIKEGTSILELALWKTKMDESAPSSNVKSVGQSNKRARVDTNISERKQCRVNCGADIVMRNVLP